MSAERKHVIGNFEHGFIGENTTGPWSIQDQGCYTLIYGPNGERVCKIMDNKKDAFLIASAPGLLAENQKLREENSKLRACHESELGVCEQHCDVVGKLREVVKLQTEALKKCQWENGGEDSEGVNYCRECDAPDYKGHKDGCSIEKAIKAGGDILDEHK
jgi:hypothetical protein